MWASLRGVWYLGIVVVIGLVAGIAVNAATNGDPLVPTTAQQIRDRTLPLRTARCAYRMQGALPDPTCTPGAINHAVTQATIKQTICKSGWTATVRPPLNVTEPEKLVAMRQYGYAFGQSPRGYEFDHLIPLELGGAPNDTRNLFPEPHHVMVGGKDVGSYTKDGIENMLNHAVCAGRMRLAAARRAIRTDWTTATP